MTFRDWLRLHEQGTKMTATGLNAGGQAQAGMGMSKPASPQTKSPDNAKISPSPFSPSDSLPKGWKPKPGPGAANSIIPTPPQTPGFLGGHKSPPGPLEGGPFGGGGIGAGSGTKAKMKKGMKKK